MEVFCFRESNLHVLSVVATDCGGKESSPVLVTITVLPTCSTEWTGNCVGVECSSGLVSLCLQLKTFNVFTDVKKVYRLRQTDRRE